MPGNSVELDFQKLNGFLKRIGLSDREINVYHLGLEKTTITSGNIVSSCGLSAQVASDIIKKLAALGFFKAEIRKGRKGAGGRGNKFRVIPPSQVFTELRGITSTFDRIDEVLENKEVIGVEDGFWELTKQETAHTILIEKIHNVENQILISSNDCSWIEDSTISNCLSNCAKRSVSIKVIVNNASPEICRHLESLGAKVYSLPSAISPPYIILDNKLLFIAYSTSQYSKRYGLLQLDNQYLISKFTGLFNSMMMEVERREQ